MKNFFFFSSSSYGDNPKKENVKRKKRRGRKREKKKIEPGRLSGIMFNDMKQQLINFVKTVLSRESGEKSNRGFLD